MVSVEKAGGHAYTPSYIDIYHILTAARINSYQDEWNLFGVYIFISIGEIVLKDTGRNLLNDEKVKKAFLGG